MQFPSRCFPQPISLWSLLTFHPSFVVVMPTFQLLSKKGDRRRRWRWRRMGGTHTHTWREREREDHGTALRINTVHHMQWTEKPWAVHSWENWEDWWTATQWFVFFLSQEVTIGERERKRQTDCPASPVCFWAGSYATRLGVSGRGGWEAGDSLARGRKGGREREEWGKGGGGVLECKLEKWGVQSKTRRGDPREDGQ